MTDSQWLDPDAATPTEQPLDDKSQQLEHLSEALEQVMQADRDFFRQNPDCDYYVRPIAAVELTESSLTGNPVSEAAMVLVGEVSPGNRIRLKYDDGGAPPVALFKNIQQRLRKESGLKPTGFKDRLKAASKGRFKGKGFGGSQQKS